MDLIMQLEKLFSKTTLEHGFARDTFCTFEACQEKKNHFEVKNVTKIVTRFTLTQDWQKKLFNKKHQNVIN